MMILRSRQNETSNPGAGRHQHEDLHELLFIETGAGRQLLGDEEVPCVAGEVYFFPPRMLHMSYCRPGESFDCLVLYCHTRDLADGHPGDGGRSLLRVLEAAAPKGGRLGATAATRQKVHRLLLRALAEQRGSLAGASAAVRCYATEAYLTLARDVTVSGPREHQVDSTAEGHVRRAQEHLVAHCELPIGLDTLLALGPLGRSSFLACYRRVTGSTVGADLFAARMEKAKALLAGTSMAVVDVAMACGFGSQSHFTHRFTDAMGMPPAQWRSRRPD